jgi:hypothetical protein
VKRETEVTAKREVRTTLTFVAAASSVTAVPLIAAPFAHLNAALVGAIIGAAATVALFATLIFWSYGRGQAAGEVAAHRRAAHLVATAELRAAAITMKSDITAAAALLLLERGPEQQVLNELFALEIEARALLGEGPTASIIRLRSRLQDSGVWSEEDVYDFDVALRTRNKVAHRDQDELNKTSLAEAIETMERLRRKLEATRISPPRN